MVVAIVSIGVEAAVLTTHGTPAPAAARATARSPSGRAAESTPTGARKNGAGDDVPSTLTRRSRCWLPASIAGRKRQREGLPVRLHRRLAARAAGDVVEG